MRSPSGCLQMALRAPCINWTQKLVAPLGCLSGILPRATATRSAASTWSSYYMNACATQTNSMPGQITRGTELNIVQEGLPDTIPPEACYLGWQEFVEPGSANWPKHIAPKYERAEPRHRPRGI